MKENDIVTRKSHGDDVVFQVIAIKGNSAILKGVDYRLIADAPIDDLNIYNQEITFNLPYLDVSPNVAPGKVLHIDGDSTYVIKSKEAYSKYGIDATCIYLDEDHIPMSIPALLSKDKYDVLVITGHDFFKIDDKQFGDDLTRYQNSINFVGAVQQARKISPDLDSLVIIAGACQSNYEALIMNGANFASSPTRDNIHMLDPIIIASVVATTSIKLYVSPKDAIDKTISKALGGIETKGKARLHYSGAIVNDNNVKSIR